jgi:hypothetical protein
MPVCTTLNQILKHNPPKGVWITLLRKLCKAAPDDEPLPLVAILDRYALSEAVWCLRTVEGYDNEIRLFAIAAAREVQHLTRTPQSVEALDVAERYAHGKATDEELKNAIDAAVAAYADSDANSYADGAAIGAAMAGWQGDSAADAAEAASDYAICACITDDKEWSQKANAKQAEIFRKFFG